MPPLTKRGRGLSSAFWGSSSRVPSGTSLDDPDACTPAEDAFEVQEFGKPVVVPFVGVERPPRLSSGVAQATQLDKYFAEPTQDYERALATRSHGMLKSRSAWPTGLGPGMHMRSAYDIRYQAASPMKPVRQSLRS